MSHTALCSIQPTPVSLQILAGHLPVCLATGKSHGLLPCFLPEQRVGVGGIQVLPLLTFKENPNKTSGKRMDQVQ